MAEHVAPSEPLTTNEMLHQLQAAPGVGAVALSHGQEMVIDTRPAASPLLSGMTYHGRLGVTQRLHAIVQGGEGQAPYGVVKASLALGPSPDDIVHRTLLTQLAPDTETAGTRATVATVLPRFEGITIPWLQQDPLDDGTTPGQTLMATDRHNVLVAHRGAGYTTVLGAEDYRPDQENYLSHAMWAPASSIVADAIRATMNRSHVNTTGRGRRAAK
jgi:hypothetical protein